ncbi:MAG: FHA domain-containing protein, partial [Myxococcota bacterium]
MSHRVQEVTAVAVIDLARLTSRPVLVGSGPRSDVVLKGASVRHARMGLDALGPWVRDLGSTEGTRVNGQPIDGRTV